jgi:predicted RNA binding protein YcfA (HicA-like mRNA interferase family)
MRSLAGTKVVSALEKAGFVVVRISGSHHIMKHPDKDETISVPVHGKKDLKRGTLRGLIRESGLTPNDFFRFVDS